jgi:hypothetical protein
MNHRCYIKCKLCVFLFFFFYVLFSLSFPIYFLMSLCITFKLFCNLYTVLIHSSLFSNLKYFANNICYELIYYIVLSHLLHFISTRKHLIKPRKDRSVTTKSILRNSALIVWTELKWFWIE